MKVETIENLVRGGKIFSVTFIKKNGEQRVMTARMGVSKGISGVGMKYNARERNLLPVYDMQKEGYRMINAETITSVRCQGVELKVNQDESI